MDKALILDKPCPHNLVVGIIFIVVAASVAHFLFSSLGFNPTDDGFILAGSRRILDGQIPHRDFISIRPAGSHFLHMPFLLFGGDYVFWISRYFVWIQFACMAWIWTVIIARSFGTFERWVEKIAVAPIAFVFSAHYFPIMAWHTIDALFLTTLGILLCLEESKVAKMAGYVILGMAPVCRLNFLPMIPITLILLNDWRQKRLWLLACIPILAYGAYLAANGAVPDAILQLTTHTNVLHAGVVRYVTTWGVPWGILIGVIATVMAYGSLDLKLLTRMGIGTRECGALVLFLVTLAAACSLVGGKYIGSASFGILGAVFGAMMYFFAKEQRLTAQIRCGLLAIFAAWCTSISLGYQTPALASGPLVLLLIACGLSARKIAAETKVSYESRYPLIGGLFHPKAFWKHANLVLILLTVVSLVAFGIARRNHIYREQAASNLRYDLSGKFAGARLIRTNENTYRFLIDLENAKNIVKDKGKRYCILPDIAANWVKSLQSNPISIDWPQRTELGRRELVDRVIGDLEANRGKVIVIVQKYAAAALSSGFTPLTRSNAVVNHVRSNFSKIGETDFFEFYE